jgi:LytS/YehU family sensor histidine kinase
VKDEILNTQIPPLTLQILIENAVKHNVASRQRPLKIDIYNSDRELVIRNNFQPKQSVSHTTGTGLDNISQRYRLLFDKDIVIEKQTDTFFVKLPIITV